MVKFPSSLVATPVLLLDNTEAPLKGKPVAWSDILPLISLFCACTITVKKNKGIIIASSLIDFIAAIVFEIVLKN